MPGQEYPSRPCFFWKRYYNDVHYQGAACAGLLKDKGVFMDASILSRLTDIENAAQETLAGLLAQKEELQKAADERLAAYDRKTEQRVEKKIGSIRSSIENELEKQLKRQQKANDRLLAAIEERFEKQSDERVLEIVRRILS